MARDYEPEPSFPKRTRDGPRIVTERMRREAESRLQGSRPPIVVRRLRSALASLLGPTDRDRLDRVFEDLETAGIVARQDFTCCCTCAVTEAVWALAQGERCGLTRRGWVFYHQQDRELALAEGRLHLGFLGASTVADLDVGNEVADSLRRYGFELDWNGTSDQRIGVLLRFRRRLLWLR